jgi:hypothetical protein
MSLELRSGKTVEKPSPPSSVTETEEEHLPAMAAASGTLEGVGKLLTTTPPKYSGVTNEVKLYVIKSTAFMAKMVRDNPRHSASELCTELAEWSFTDAALTWYQSLAAQKIEIPDWDALCVLLQKQFYNPASKIKALDNLLNARQGNASLAEYVPKFKGLVDDATINGISMEPQMYWFHFDRGLNPFWKKKAAYNCYLAEAEGTWPEDAYKLMRLEAQMPAKLEHGSQPHPNARRNDNASGSSSSSNWRNRDNRSSRGNADMKKNKYDGASSSKDTGPRGNPFTRPGTKCYKCQKMGHFAYECLEGKDASGSKK